MRPLLDNADENDLAPSQPLFAWGALPSHGDPAAPTPPLFGGGAVADQRDQAAPAQHHRARLAAVDLDDQILVAPDRDEQARGVSNTIDDPIAVAAAQPGPLEAGRRVGIVP